MSTIFVTGPTGVLGRATIPLLVARGDMVRALSRSEANDAAIRALGAQPVRGSLFDVASLVNALSGADAFLHLATRIPPSVVVRRREAWHENDYVRTIGTRNLVNAGLQAGVRVFVYPSFAFVYPDSGDAWIDAETTAAKPVETVKSTIAAEREVARFAGIAPAGERRGVALRLGALYGPDLPSTLELIEMAKRGLTVFGGPGSAYAPTLWIGDAASALIAALDRAPSGLFDVVDDEPLQHRELASLTAGITGKQWLFSPPAWMVTIMAGPAGEAISRSLRVSNRRFHDATGWSPTVSNAREGFARIAETLEPPVRTRVPAMVTAGLWLLALVSLAAGLAQQFAPRWFYDAFPGFGMSWVSIDGPYNEHMLRDLGGANLALAVVLLFAIARPSAGLTRAVALAVLAAQVPHFLYHAAHLGLMPTLLEQVLQTVSLTALLLVAALVLVRAGGITKERVDIARPRAPIGIERAGRRPRLAASTR
jgi:nucleoside-diphosphate-sugar epimerase